MAKQFDPYHKWLAIPPQEQPPNHYRLLGVSLFESDPDVIDSAADKCMAHLRSFQTGQNAAHAQKLLNEVSAARVCLLNADQRATYDMHLRQTVASTAASPNVSSANVVAPASSSDNVQTPVSTTTSIPTFAAEQQTPSMSRRAKKTPGWVIPVVAIVTTILLAAIGTAVMVATGEKDETANVNEADHQLDSANTTNDQAVPDEQEAIPGKQDDPSDPQNDIPFVGSKTDQTAFDIKTQEPKVDNPNPVVQGDQTNSANPNESDPKADATDPPKVSAETPPSVAISDEPAKKQPLPSDARKQEILASIEEAYRLSEATSFEAKLKVAADLYALSKESNGNLDEKFVLLRTAMEFARDGGDAALMLEVADAMAGFEVELLNIKRSFLLQFAEEAKTVDAIASLVDNSKSILEDLVNSDDAAAAQLLAKAVYSAASRPGAKADSRKKAYDQQKQIDKVYQEAKRIENAVATLKQNPDDPQANLAVGRWRCFTKGDWEIGLPLLAKGSDASLKQLAQREAVKAESVGDQVAIADAWWVAANSASSNEKRHFLARAAHWYSIAKPNAASGIEKLKIEKRLAEIGDVVPSQTASSDRPVVAKRDKPKRSASANRPADPSIYIVDVPGDTPVPFVEGTLAFKHSNRHTYADLPQALASGFVIFRGANVKGKGNTTHFNVVQDGMVYLIMSRRPGGGGSEGDWKKEIISPEQLLLEGWRPVEKVSLIPNNHGSVIYGRQCKRGESFTYSWEKYIPPGLIVPEIENATAIKKAEPGKWIDLLELADVQRNAVAGNWVRQEKSVVSEPGFRSRLAIPLKVDGSFDLHAEFIRREGNSTVGFILPVGARSCILVFAANGNIDGIDKVDGIGVAKNSTRIPTSVKTGQPYVIDLSVRIDGNEARIDVTQNDKDHVKWRGKPSSLSLYEGWSISGNGQIGLATHQSTVVFQNVRLLLSSAN